MGRIVVNKHFDLKSEITSGAIINNGEIVISNQVANGKARIMSFESTYFTKTENKTDENEMANIAKKEYETLLSCVNQMAELLNKLKKIMFCFYKGILFII